MLSGITEVANKFYESIIQKAEFDPADNVFRVKIRLGDLADPDTLKLYLLVHNKWIPAEIMTKATENDKFPVPVKQAMKSGTMSIFQTMIFQSF